MPDSPGLPATLRWAVGILLAEAAGIAVIAGLLAYEDLFGTTSNTRAAVSITVYAAVMAAVLALLGVSLARRRAWPRGPAIALQLLAFFLAFNMIGNGVVLVGVPLAAAAIATTILLVTPATREALGIR
jgi:hypothetical protein